MSAAIFKGAYVKLLAKAGIEFNDGVKMITGLVDPLTTAIDAPIGSMYVNANSLGIFIKLDAGLTTNWKPLDVSEYTKEATGLADPTQYTTNYNNATRTFSITPVGAYFDVLYKGRIFRKTVAESVVHANVAGEYFCEYDGTGTLTASTTPFDFKERVQVRVARFDPLQTPTGWSLNENHGVNLSADAHTILHATIGTRLVSGGTITGGTITVRAPSDTYNAANSALAIIQPGIDATVLADEDIRTSLSALLEATGYSVMRKRWTANNYEWNVGQVAPFWRVLNVPQYNPASGGNNWVPMTNNAYTCWYLVSIPAGIEADSQTMRYFWYNGGAQYVPSSSSTANRTIALNNALAEDPGNINLTDLISTEYNILHKFVVSYDTGSTGNDYRLRIEGSQSIRGNRSRPITTSGIVSTSHASLSDLAAPGAHPATSITAAPVSGQLNPAVETDVELALDRLSEYGGITAYTAAKVYRIGNLIQIDGYVFKAIGNFTATTWATDYGSCELINVPTINGAGGLRAIGGSFNKVVRLGSVSEYGKFYEFKTGTVTARGIPDINGVGYYDPIETNFERFAHANSFAVGDVCYRIDGSTWGKAKADSEATIQTIGVISFVNGNVFHVTYGGVIQLSGRTAATSYFVSDATAGLATTTRPTTVGNFDAPIYDALTTTLVMVRPLRAVVIGATNVKSTSNHPGGATSLVMDVSAYEGGRIEGTLIIGATTKSWWELRFVKAADGNYYGSSSSVGDALSGLSLAVTNAGLVQFTLPGATAGAYNYTLNGPAVGATFPLAISAGLVLGRTDGSSVPTGILGEVVEGYQSASAVTTASADTEVDVGGAEITLTAGEWDIYYSASVALSRVSGSSTVIGRVRITDSSNAALTETETPIIVSAPTGAVDVWQQNSIMRRLAFTGANRTYKLRLTCSVAAATGALVSWRGNMSGSITGNEGTTYIRAVRRG